MNREIKFITFGGITDECEKSVMFIVRGNETVGEIDSRGFISNQGERFSPDELIRIAKQVEKKVKQEE
jgi:hypothetical protein